MILMPEDHKFNTKKDDLVFAALAEDPNLFMLGSSQLPISPASGDLTPSFKLQGQLIAL